MSRPARTSAVLVLTAALCLPTAALSPVSAASPNFPDTIALADGSRPEGIATGAGTTFYAGARSDGAIYLGDVRTGALTLLAQGREGGAARGLMLDRSSGLLWVAGDERDLADPTAPTTSTVIAYDSRTGEPVRRIVVPGARFLNDVQVTSDAVYVTDSRNAELVVITDSGFSLLPLTGDFVQPAGFGANGIRELPGGDLVIVSAGELYRVDPETGVADLIEVTGGDLTSGDGLELRGNTLYVVFGLSRDDVAVVRLRNGGRSGVVTGAIGDPDTLDRPTTAVLIAGSLYAVNGRFSTPPTSSTPYEVTRIALR